MLAPAPGLQFKQVLQRAIIWTLVCGFAAVPSFWFALDEGFDAAGMIAGIAVFVALYTIYSCTEPFVRRWRGNQAFRVTLYIGYSLRMAVGVFPPIGFIVDFIPGMISVGIVESLGLAKASFICAMVTTIVQGALLSAIVAFLMWIMYVLLRGSFPPPREQLGFPVIPVAMVAPPSHPIPSDTRETAS